MKLANTLVAIAMTATPALAQDDNAIAGGAQAYYASRYFVAGFLMRASAVCGGDWKRTVAAGSDILRTAELKAISRGFPNRTREWMMEGADNFNAGVMADGIGAACSYALEVRAKAEAMK
jgi:hypothetical protein